MLELTQTVAISFTITTAPGIQPLYAGVSTGGANASLLNDQVILSLGHLSAPVMHEVTPSDFTPDALEIGWYPAIDENALSYRVLRALDPAGPFEVIGETQQAAYTDVLVERGVSYCYAVQSYNGGGNLSAQSDVICGMLPVRTTFLPMVIHP